MSKARLFLLSFLFYFPWNDPMINSGQGHCHDDTGCLDNDYFTCRPGTCLDTSVFPSDVFYNNSLMYSNTDSCCSRSEMARGFFEILTLITGLTGLDLTLFASTSSESEQKPCLKWRESCRGLPNWHQVEANRVKGYSWSGQ